MKTTIVILLSLVLILLIHGCITIETVPRQSPPSSSQPEEDEPDLVGRTPPVIEYFTVNPPLINSGDTATLSWSVSGANSVSIAPFTGQVESAGSMQVSLDESTSYTLTAVNSVGTVNSSIKLTVQSASYVPPTQEAFAVIEVVAGTEASPGPCPEILYADITTNGAGTVNYRWESAEGGGNSYTFNTSFTSAGTKRVTLFQEMRALPSGMYQIHIMSPNGLISNATHYTTCGP